MTIYLAKLTNLKKLSKISRRQITISQFLDIPVLEIAELILCQIVISEKQPNIIAAKYSPTMHPPCHVNVLMVKQISSNASKVNFGNIYILYIFHIGTDHTDLDEFFRRSYCNLVMVSLFCSLPVYHDMEL